MFSFIRGHSCPRVKGPDRREAASRPCRPVNQHLLSVSSSYPIVFGTLLDMLLGWSKEKVVLLHVRTESSLLSV